MKTIKAYFFTTADADKAKAALRAGYAVFGPTWAEPRNGRSVLLEVEVTTGLQQAVPARDWSRIIGLVQKFDGWVWNTEA